MDQTCAYPDCGIMSKWNGNPFQVLRKEKVLCPCCMERHEVFTIVSTERNLIKEGWVNYTAVHYYCDNACELYDDEDMMSFNHASMELARRTGCE